MSKPRFGVNDWNAYYRARKPGFWQIPDPILSCILADVDRTISVLDVGCGYGELVNRIGERGLKDVSGMDSSFEAVKAAVCANPSRSILLRDIETDRIARHGIVFLSLVLPFLRDKRGVLQTLNESACLIVLVTPLVSSRTSALPRKCSYAMRELELENLLHAEFHEWRVLYRERRAADVFNVVHLARGKQSDANWLAMKRTRATGSVSYV